MLRYIGDRSSLLCIGQLPLVILTAGRSFPLPFFLTSIDYGTAMLYHRWTARMVWWQVNVHALAWTLIVLGRDGGWLRMFSKAYWLWGCFVSSGMGKSGIRAASRCRPLNHFVTFHVLQAIAMMWGLTLLSIREVRRRNYEVRLSSEWSSSVQMRLTSLTSPPEHQLFIAGHVALAFGGCIASYEHIELISTGRVSRNSHSKD
jgi:hypothetical protein